MTSENAIVSDEQVDTTLLPLNIQRGKPNRGPVYMGTCPACGKRKRISQYASGNWWFWCSRDCSAEQIELGTTAELEAMIK